MEINKNVNNTISMKDINLCFITERLFIPAMMMMMMMMMNEER